MSFDKLTLVELNRTADNDFAFELSAEEKKSKKLVLAAFAEAELKFSDYLLANPDQAEKYAPVQEVPLVEEEPSDTNDGIAPQFGNAEVGGVVVKENRPVVAESAPYLVKMDRENPYYEVGRYKFTVDNPYVLVDARDAESVLREPGFRQAFPSELEEYYN